jgi:hypothetical protein
MGFFDCFSLKKKRLLSMPGSQIVSEPRSSLGANKARGIRRGIAPKIRPPKGRSGKVLPPHSGSSERKVIRRRRTEIFFLHKLRLA